MDNDKSNILEKLRGEDCIKIFKDAGINIAIVFGSIVTDDFEEYSDIDIAILSRKDITFNTIVWIEEALQKILERDIDVINLKAKDMEINMKVSIYDNGQIVYDDDGLKLYNIEYAEIEQLYKDNETFRFFRERDVIFSE